MVIIGALGGIIYTIYYALKQFPPYYIPSLFPLGDVLLFVLIGMIGAYMVRARKNIIQLTAYGALASAIAGAISAVTVAVLHAIYYPPEAITSLGSLPYYALLYGYWLVTIGIAALILGAIGGVIYWIVARLLRTIKQLSRL